MSVRTRESGLLLHITSLPGPFGIGDLGYEAYRFADFLADAGQTLWQVLPIVPTDPAFGNSPYSSSSAFAGNSLLISPELLLEENLIAPDDLQEARVVANRPDRVDYVAAARAKNRLLTKALRNFRTNESRFLKLNDRFGVFCRQESFWLDNYALFTALKRRFGDVCWGEWPEPYRKGDWSALRLFAQEEENGDYIELLKFSQFLFYHQWRGLKAHCKSRGVELMGDIPIYVAYDSADVWARQDLFDLDGMSCRPCEVAGVPPDYFSATGQLWGNPIYRWDRIAAEGYSWWVRRVAHTLNCFDRFRIDHFRGFASFWAVPGGECTAERGRWIEGPGADLFHALQAALGSKHGKLPIVAEDLGVITEDVEDLMETLGYPGMKVLHFAFGKGMECNPYIPHQYDRNCVVYTGTHDNNTTLGWWQNDASPLERHNFREYYGDDVDEGTVAHCMLRMALASVARLAVIPVQDVLGLGASARMNLPGSTVGNWEWRLLSEQLSPQVARRLRQEVAFFGRSPCSEGRAS